MKEMLKDFKKFAIKGNIIDLSVGVIIGTAFGKITASLVNDIIMPILSLVIGRINLTTLSFILVHEIEGRDAVTLKYGNFIQMILEFLIISFSIFLLLKYLNKVRSKIEVVEEKKAELPPADVRLLTEIRDILKEKK